MILRRWFQFVSFSVILFGLPYVQVSAQEAQKERPSPKGPSQQIRFEKELFSLNTGLDDFRVAIKNEWQAYGIGMMAEHGYAASELRSPTICRPLAEMAHVYFCGSYKQRHQNYIFARIAIFNEGAFGISKGTVATIDDSRVEALYEEIGGVDLRGDIVKAFFAKVPTDDLSEDEKAFRDNVFNPILDREGDHPFFLITISIQSGMDISLVLSHEALHAQYYIDLKKDDGKLHDAIEEYYSEHLTEQERAYVLRNLSIGGLYNVNDPFVLYKEFYSYMLEGKGARLGRLRGLVQDKGDDFRSFIESETGMETIQLPQ